MDVSNSECPYHFEIRAYYFSLLGQLGCSNGASPQADFYCGGTISSRMLISSQAISGGQKQL